MTLTDSLMPIMKQANPANIEPIDWYTANILSNSVALDKTSLTIWRNIVILLSLAQRQGHTCLDLSTISGNSVLNCDDSETPVQFPDTEELIRIVGEACSALSEALIRLDNTRLYTQRYWSFERDLADAICKRNSLQVLTSQQYEDLKRIWTILFPLTTQTEDWQQVATAASLILPFCIINGGPGTGKTYTVARMLLALQCVGSGTLNIQLAAPTGKAAQRLGESITQNIETLAAGDDSALVKLAQTIPTQAVTLHRLLGISPFQVNTKKNQDNLLNCDVLIIDEASMVDLALMVRVVRALKPDCKLILVGDADQLPAIESGNVLEALVSKQNVINAVNSDMLEHVKTLNSKLELKESQSTAQPFTFTLQKSQRFGGELAVLAELIQSGESEQAWLQVSKKHVEQLGSIFSHQSVSRLTPEQFSNNATALIQQCFEKLFTATTAEEAISATQFCRWLTPVKKGPLGVATLNQKIEIIAKQKMAKANLHNKTHFSRFYAGQPIMVLENSYANKLYNGDVGIIWSDGNGNLKAWFETENNNLRSVSLTRLPKVQTAYAMTVHKSQGSEFSNIVMILPAGSTIQQLNMNSRELLYTGLTRAKQSCLFVCEQEDFIRAVETRQQRFSGLRELIERQTIIMKERA